MRRIRHLLPVAAVLVLVAGACSDDGGGDSASADTHAAEAEALSATTAAPVDEISTEEAPPETTGAAAPATDGDSTPAEGSAVVPAALRPQDIGRDIVYTADVEIAVPDVSAAAEQALRSVETVGGLLFGQDTSGGRTRLTFKVAPEDFQSVLRSIGGLGELRSQSVTADDVTERVVDLESRITTAERSVARLNDFLATAPGLTEVATLEAQLLERETVLEQLRGQLRTIQNQVSLATIVVTIVQLQPEPALELVQTAYPGHDAGRSCPGAPELAVDEGDSATVCYVVTNTGNAALGDIEIADDVLDFAPSDLIAVTGDPGGPLAPGDSLVVAVEVTVDESVRPAGGVTALPLGDDGQPLDAARVGQRAQVDIEAAADDSLPGIGGALSAGWNAFVVVVTLIALGLAVALPFLWPVAIVALVLWWSRRRRRPAAAPPVDVPEEAPAEPVDA